MRETELRTRLRLIPLLICCLSGPVVAAGLPPLVISPDLVKNRPTRPAPAVSPAETKPPVSSAPPARDSEAVSTTQPRAPAADRAGGRAAVPFVAPAPADSERPVLAPGATEITAEQIYGTRSVELVAEGEAELRRDDVQLSADRLVYREVTDEAEAYGNVRLQQGTTVVSGPEARLKVGEQLGEFASPQYSLTRESEPTAPGDTPRVISGSGSADTMYFEGENQYRLKNATWSTCEPDDPDWYIKARDLQLDYDREVGTARGASVVFKDAPIFWWPWAEFPLVAQRQSGFLAPSYGVSNKVGVDVSVPYYWNIAPNYDLTIAPRFMGRRGVQLANEFRYLTPGYSGELQVEWLPKDRVTGEERTLGSLQHQQVIAPGLFGSIDLNAVSDDEYFEDLSSNVSVASKVNLLREGRLTYVPSDWWSASALVQSYQTLVTDEFARPDEPYRRVPQLLLNANRADLPAGTTFAFRGEYVQFDHPDANRPEGSRFTLYPQLALPFERPGYYVTPKVGVHHTQYKLDHDLAGESRSITRSLPIFTLDAGLNFERDTNVFGGDYLQTLEPRIYYVNVPHEDQSEIPIFDTARYDFGFAQIFSENLYSGGDRIADANQITAAVTSRLVEPETGAERLRATVGQRYYLEDQQVTLPGESPRTGRRADLLAAFSGRVTQTSSIESSWQYNPNESWTERFNFGVRYQPGYAKALNMRYRYSRRDVLTGVADAGFEDVDVSGQWPLGRNWYGVARVTRSLKENRITETIAGLEYDGGCWALRTAIHRFATNPEDVTQAIFVQLELNGLASVGSSPINLLKRSVPGYGKINEPVDNRVFGAY